MPIVDSEAGVATIEFYQTVMRENLVHPDTIAWGMGEKRGSFIGGDAAMVEGIGWHVMTPMQEAGLEYNDNWDVTGTHEPHRDGAADEAWLPQDVYPYLVSSNTDHPEAVLRVLQYLADPEISKEVGMRYQPAARHSFMEAPEVVGNAPWIRDMQEDAALVEPSPHHSRMDEIHTILIDMMQEALTNPHADAQEMAAEYQERLDALE